ncbi:hypothetical protein [Salinimicrobium sp. TH3]|uniref:hypothetical protein n=1 Tax=Salinimicrobium sp. TH3 TaxID=2997342 RepID=UPI00227502B5|nr:hypothetical protein [Salinimicrobium sp. TH3]MCY2685632.1 hypothetical protein [Salinimicrobium sp. TH3]
MKKLILLLLISTLLSSCREKQQAEEQVVVESSPFETEFIDYRDLKMLAGYEKVIDTSVYMGTPEDTYRLLNLRKNGDYLVLFYKVAGRDEQEIKHTTYLALDTLLVKKLRNDERVTVGYCYHVDYHEGEIVALVKGTGKTDVMETVRAWRANPESEEIEPLQDFGDIKCLDQFFESENSTIPIEDIS